MKQLFTRRRPTAIVLLLVLVAILPLNQVAAQAMQAPAPEGSVPVDPKDPYENWNRKVFSFNRTIDRWFLKPVAKAYRAYTPQMVDRGITNFFNNLTELRNFSNSVFQLKGESAVVAFGRFTYNTVFGLGGLIDVATAFDLPERPEDFGQTLGYWGVGSGPYLMLPLLGPSTPRHFGGFVTDAFALPSAWDAVESPEVYFARSLQVVDKRADLIPAESFISGDSYTFVRNAFLQRRAFLINDGEVINDPFASGNDEELMLENF
ncbi:MlaA family lipoprotein [Marinobacter subterrani]|uniref:ABC-type transporter Mla maintaining outer membrane lipid asymmetry, lipoprotein component MlaA n=1 Tax=Marinobacter subterrani TaxID=1658765 RepID=A0A0J7M0C9_9GAMM|nr:VacJ family lipoprotein [Marinobacter subterrani]KMQ74565.1 ABC-type transporter Mla maintaining outer membrane lipid asymmetry, lipoprotein component MlaA [Marinobacter subterrani]